MNQGCGKQNPIPKDNSGKIRMPTNVGSNICQPLIQLISFNFFSALAFGSHSYSICINSSLNPTCCPGILQSMCYNVLEKHKVFILLLILSCNFTYILHIDIYMLYI